MSSPTQITITSGAHLDPRDLERLQRWNDTRAAYPTGDCLHELVEAQVDRAPDRVAVSFEGRRLTYGELDARANRLAHRLRRAGVDRDAPVGVCLQRSPELVVSLLAVLKAGGCYVPLDPEYPRDRIRFMAEDAGVSCVLVHAATTGMAPDGGATRIRVDREPEGQEADGAPRMRSAAAPDSLAYVLYTSGSTGRPKGVMVEHRSIVNRLHWMQEHFGIDGSDVLVQKTPFSFDVSVWEFFWPLMTGARLEVVRPGGHMDAGHLARTVERAGITVMHFVPSMLDLFLDRADVGARCGSLEHVICSGEALPRDLVDRFYRTMPEGVTLWNLYGPTEAAVDVTWWECRRGADDPTVPIGRPVANTRIHIVGEDGEILPPGEVGELVIGGIQVARGYRGRAELTAAKFVPEPGSTVDGDSWPAERRGYRTGDLARWRDDGAVEFLGRVDHQVKIRGQRIELGEIEAVLRQQPHVLQAAALLRKDPGSGERLVAYVVTEEGRPFDEEALRRGLSTDLTDAMMPSVFVALEEMPLSPNGKLDRSALPEPANLRPDLGIAFVEPRDVLERFLAGLWAEVLGLDRVGIHDPFFELGGSSLHAARVVNRLQDELGSFLYVVTLFDSSTVADYADFLRSDYLEAVEDRFGADIARSARSGPPESATVSGRSRQVDGPRGAGARTSDRNAGPGAERASRSDRDDGRMDEADIRRFEEAVPRFPVDRSASGSDRRQNDPAVFILAPPRSGTTLLRVMLAGHPDLFAAAELQLLHFEDLVQRRQAFSGKHRVWLEGVVRTLMELDGLSPDEARERMGRWEDEEVDVAHFYGLLQERLNGRTLVEKTPSYALDPNALERAERDFRDARYVQLVRHPYAMVESFVSYHMEQILYLHEHPFGARKLGELVWTLSHRTVNRFFEGIPDERKHRMRFEDMVRDPRGTMQTLAAHLDIPYRDSLTRPYESLSDKMVDGVHDDSTPMGDTRLLERDEIDPAVADRWKGVLDDDYLGGPTRELARNMGYEESIPDGGPSDGPGRRAALRRRRSRSRARGRNRSPESEQALEASPDAGPERVTEA